MADSINGIEIPEYQKEDYLYTNEPFEFVFQFRDDPFAMDRALRLVANKAKDAGFTGFKKSFDSFMKSAQGNKHDETLQNSTNFEGQELELFSGQYVCDDLGVTFKNLKGGTTIVCTHPIMPVQRLINIDTEEEWLKIAYKKGQYWRNVIVEKSKIASANSILSLAASGVVVSNANAKELSQYLLEIEQINYDALPEQKSVSRMGWVNGMFSPYVEDLHFDGENNFKHIFNNVKSRGNRDKWVDTIRKLRKEKTAVRFALAASFASVILEPCGLLPFFVHLWGGTEVGKTVSNMVAASVWANPRIGEYTTTFNSTTVGQEMTASFLNSMPMCIDELQIQITSGIKDFDKLIYQLTEGVGRTRGSKFGGLQKTNTWRNCFITNGEHPISRANSGGGAVNRVIEIEVVDKIYHELPKLCDVLVQNYGFAGREFVEWLQAEGNIEKVVEIQKEYYREILEYETTEKQSASASALLTADKIVTDLIFKDGNNLTVEEMTDVMIKKNDVDANKRTYEFICDFVATNSNKFKMNASCEYPGESWGKIEDGYVYIVKTVFDRELSNAGLNSASFLSWANRRGLLQTRNGRRTLMKRIGGFNSNCVCIKERTNADDFEFTNSETSDDDLPFC